MFVTVIFQKILIYSEKYGNITVPEGKQPAEKFSGGYNNVD